MTKGDTRRALRSNLVVPAFGVFIGVVAAVLALLGGRSLANAASWFAIMVGYSALLVIGHRRSETVRLLGGGDVDERDDYIQRTALQIVGIVMVAVTLIGAFAELARGRDLWPWDFLASVGGFSYLVGLVIARRGAT